MAEALTVVKVGGSLYDLPDLRNRLSRWLEQVPAPILLVPGGGRMADVVRDFDALHGLGEERSHWLALRAMALNAAFLADLLSDAIIIDHPLAARWQQISVLDAFAFATYYPSTYLPHDWTVTSDSMAAHAAIVVAAKRLILLKSVTMPPEMDWATAGRQGFVDPLFAEVIRQAPTLVVEAINFRGCEFP